MLGLVLFLGGLLTSGKQGLSGEVNFRFDKAVNFRFDKAYLPFNGDISDWLTMPFQNDGGEWVHLPFKHAVDESLTPSPLSAVLLAMFVWALRESTQSPRHEKMTTTFDCFRMFMQFVGDLLLTPIYLLRPGELNEVKYLPTPENERILSACPSLKRFWQMPLFRNALFAFAVLVVMDFVGVDKKAVEREPVEAADGGIIALDWWGGKPTAEENKKILFVGSTWTGDAFSTCTRDVCKYFTARGWQCVVMVKRGCGLNMRNVQPQVSSDGKPIVPWCFQGFEDFQLAIDHVAKNYPGQTICGVGHSLGAAHIRNYVHRSGDKCKLAAAIVVDCGEDWIECIESLDRRLPTIGKVLKGASDASLDACHVPKAVKSGKGKSKRAGVASALRRSVVVMASAVAQVFTGASPTSTQEEDIHEGPMMEFVRTRLAPAHGYEASVSGAMKYLRTCQIADPAGGRVPTLELVSWNDLLIPVEMVRNLQRMYLANPNIVTCVSVSGTHVVRWEGLRAHCWMSKVAYEFVEAALLAKSGAPARQVS